MNDGTGTHRRWRRRASTVLCLGVITVVAAAVPAFAHPVFPNGPPGFPNPQGSTASPYPAGSRPTLNMFLPFEQDGVTFKGAVNTTVDVKVTIPAGWTSPACGAASTSTGYQQVGSVVPGWMCTLETVSGHQVLHWHGPQVSPAQSEADSAQFFTFPVTVPSPATQTSYGATGSTAEGFYVEQAYADKTTSLWRTPNSTRPGDVANGIVRTVARTAATPPPAATQPPGAQPSSTTPAAAKPAGPPPSAPPPTGPPAATAMPSATAQDSPAPASTATTPMADAQSPSVEQQLTQQRAQTTDHGVGWQIVLGVLLGVVLVVGAVIAVVWRRRSSP